MTMTEQFAQAFTGAPIPAEAAPVFAAAHPDALELQPAPIEPAWVISGAPQARAKLHSQSADGFASTTIWDCTAGAFRWNFVWDETVVILDGAVRVTDATGTVTTLGKGDVAFFAGGTWATWEIDGYVRKIAFCRRVFPRPVVAAISLKTRLKSLLRGNPGPATGPALGGASPA